MTARVSFLGQFGDDLMVVNAARVSYDRVVTSISDRDSALIQRLARDGHTSPFYHPQAQFRVAAPLYVAAQLKRHHVGFAWNEVSRRYTSQDVQLALPELADQAMRQRFETLGQELLSAYHDAIAAGTPREQARAILPQGTITTWLWTGSLYAWAKLCRDRTHPAAQEETRQVGSQIADYMSDAFPISWAALLA